MITKSANFSLFCCFFSEWWIFILILIFVCLCFCFINFRYRAVVAFTNMKTTFACLLVAVCLAMVASQKTYTNKFDNVDVDGVLGNNRILTNYIKCLMEKGPCTPEGRELKSEFSSMHKLCLNLWFMNAFFYRTFTRCFAKWMLQVYRCPEKELPKGD